MTAIERIHDFWPEWTIEQQIGSDSYGTFYRASKNTGGKFVYSSIRLITIPQSPTALDEVPTIENSEQSARGYFRDIVQNYVNQISLMMNLRESPNIAFIEDYYVYEYPDEIRWDIFIRTEYLTCLSDYLTQNELSEDAVCKLGIDICRAVSLLQKRNIIHRDIRPNNIFISKDGDFKLGNPGVAGAFNRLAGTMSSGDIYDYMAPEMFHQKDYTSTVDIYSLGIVMYTLLNNNCMPFIDAKSDYGNISAKEQALTKRLSGYYLSAPANASAKMSKIILDACRFDSSQRYQSPDEMSAHLYEILNTYGPVTPAAIPTAAVIASIITCCISLFIIGYLIAPKIFGENKSISVNTNRQHEHAEASESVHTQEIKQKEPTPTYIPTATPVNESTAAATSSSDKGTDKVTNSVALSSVDNIVYIADVYESLTLRNAPSTSAAALCLLPPFTELYITEFTNDTMVKVITIGTEYTGYVNKNYLARKGTVTQRAGKSKPAASTGQIYYADVYDFLTLRNAASTSAGEIDRLLPFTAMRVESWSNGMAYVTVLETNQTGYVNGDYITTDPNSTKRAGKSKSPVNMTGHGFSVGNYCFADVKEYLTLRNAPSTSAGELARLPDDTMMVILEICNEKMMKVQVVSTGQVGYVNRNYVK